MSNVISTDLAIIGGGSGGLSLAAGAAQMGARVVLAESGKMGGDCLNYGCVPSKALLAAAHAAAGVQHGARFGIEGTLNSVDFGRVHDHIHDVIAGIAPHDSVERFQSLGVNVIEAAAKFNGPNTLDVGGQRVQAKRIVIATGSRAAIPPIPGLADTPFLTNETIFELRERPGHLLIIGGGPIGLEMAQAFIRLGSKVTVIEGERILGKDDPDAAELVKQRLLAEGIQIVEGHKVSQVTAMEGAGVRLQTQADDGEVGEHLGTHLLVAAGRAANVDGLDLDAAGIEYDRRGITVDSRLRTTNKAVYAIGDVAGGFQFTHVASYHASVVLKNVLFRLPSKARQVNIPWVTYTDPEVAQVGLTEQQAKEQHAGAMRTLRFDYADNDRARAERLTDGFIKAITTDKGKILGATIVGARAGELLQPWVLALEQNMKLSAMASTIAPYPTLSELNKRVAGSFYTEKLFGKTTQRIVRLLLKFP